MTAPLVCRAEPEELDEIIELDRAVLPGCPWTPEPDAALFVVRDIDDRVCAYASACPSIRYNHVTYFDRAGVAPHARGRGLQRRLIRARLAWSRSRGNTHAITYTAAHNIVSANNLIRCGFRLYEPAKPWAGLAGSLYWMRRT